MMNEAADCGGGDDENVDDDMVGLEKWSPQQT